MNEELEFTPPRNNEDVDLAEMRIPLREFVRICVDNISKVLEMSKFKEKGFLTLLASFVFNEISQKGYQFFDAKKPQNLPSISEGNDIFMNWIIKKIIENYQAIIKEARYTIANVWLAEAIF